MVMAEFTCPIVELGKVGKHPQADSLSISTIEGNPVIFKLGEFKAGDRVIYIPEEAVLPILPQYSFVWQDRENPSTSKRTVWAKRIRNIFSCGLVFALPEEYKDLPTGTDLKERLGITKYEPPEEFKLGGENESPPGWFPCYTEIESLRKYHHLLNVGERVVMTEKLHGCNTRYSYVDERLWIGSHHNVKRLEGTSTWNVVAEKLKLAERLSKYPGLVIYGEIYGNTQKGFQYDSPGKSSFRVFDIYSTKDGKYVDYAEYVRLCDEIGLERVPLLYEGPWNGIEAHAELAEVLSLLNPGHIREGYVVRPIVERWNEETRRTIFKMVGETYLLKKGRK
jgi:RNA ligase (TIGR02306 family)